MNDEEKKKWQQIYGQVKNLSAIFGPALMMGEMNNAAPNVLKMGLGGAMSGLGMAGPLGAILGGIGGLVGGAKKRADYKMYQDQEYENMISNKTVQPSYYAKTGGILMPVDDSGAIKLQAQKGEVAALPNGMIADVMAKETHKQMKKDKVTDVMPVGTFIGDTEGELRREDAEKIKLGAMPMTYSEKGEDKEFKEILLSDLFGNKKKLKAAELLNKAKKHIKIPERVDDEIHDPFSIATAQDNLKTRAKYISGIMELSARSDSKLRRQMDEIARLQTQENGAA